MGAQIHAGRGDEGTARAWAERAVTSGRGIAAWWWELRGLAAVLLLELTLGDAEAAAEAAIAVRDLSARPGERYEPGWNRVHGDVVEGLVVAHRLDEAEVQARWLEDRAAGGHPWSVMVAARSRGLLEASSGRAEQALVHFDRSLRADAANEMALERGRTLLAMGRVLRSANRRRSARETLTEARTIFERCGSRPWAARAAAELAGVSGRVASPTELTGTERRVAELAAEGKTNREIAEELFVSARTVESHLSSTFRKLGIRTRAGLASALARRGSD
jgi:DNA-binding CsgD family transcriptional regulator